ncbi:MAG: hypothetical protein ACJ751_14260, partial [Niastella sp.]|uniref:hypothetical protein n=1 Tax=Niastella sp. TaxID=1869183 RepID=UPI00389B0ABD
AYHATTRQVRLITNMKGEKNIAILNSTREAGQLPTLVLRDAFYNSITTYIQVIFTKKVVGKNHSNSFKSLKRL